MNAIIWMNIKNISLNKKNPDLKKLLFKFVYMEFYEIKFVPQLDLNI